MSVQLRPYVATDAETLVDLFRGSVRRVARGDYTEAQVLAWAPNEIDVVDFGARYAATQTWVAEIDGVVVGFSDFEPGGHINRMFVHPDHQRKGVATALLDRVEARARQGGVQRLYSEVSITARPFFERRGFVVTEEQDVFFNGQHFTNFAMEKIFA